MDRETCRALRDFWSQASLALVGLRKHEVDTQMRRKYYGILTKALMEIGDIIRRGERGDA